jgi:hypothetical protein
VGGSNREILWNTLGPQGTNRTLSLQVVRDGASEASPRSRPLTQRRQTVHIAPGNVEYAMATYDQIRADVRIHAGFDPKTCWIAHVKELNGLHVRPSWNRRSVSRQVPCPPERRSAIEAALRRLGMI